MTPAANLVNTKMTADKEENIFGWTATQVLARVLLSRVS